MGVKLDTSQGKRQHYSKSKGGEIWKQQVWVRKIKTLVLDILR